MHWGHVGHHYMAKANLKIICDYAEWLLENTQRGDTFADWMEYKVSIARQSISDATHAWEGMADRYRAKHRTNPHQLSYMLRRNLHDLHEYACKLHDMIIDGESLPDWMEHKISVARSYVASVKHSVQNQLRESGWSHHNNGAYNTNPW